jgi:hypothetical protein
MSKRLITRTLIIATFINLSFLGDYALSQPSKITVVFGNEEKQELLNWSFVYHVTRRNKVLPKGKSPKVIEKKSQNLYLMERYDNKEDKTDYGKGSEIKIDSKNLASIEYLWNWNYGSMEKVVITLKDGTKLKRLRLGPISVSFVEDSKFLHGDGIYLEGNYTLNGNWRHLKYNLNKWRMVEIPKNKIIKKIIFN